MSVRTRRAKSLIGQSRSSTPGPQYHRKRHQRRENRLRLAALRQLSAQQVRDRAAKEMTSAASLGHSPGWRVRATTVLFSAAMTLLIVGVARTFSGIGSDVPYHLGLAVVATALTLLGLSWRIRMSTESPVTTANRNPVTRIIERLQTQTGSTYDDQNDHLRNVFSLCAFAGGLTMALLPLILRIAVAADQWLENAFVWYVMTQTLRLLVLLAAVMIVPLYFLWFGLRTARFLIRQSEGEVSSIPLLLLFGGMLGLAGAELVRNAVSSPATLLVASAIPCFVIPILWLWKAEDVESTRLATPH